jgi:hypothetical protein
LLTEFYSYALLAAFPVIGIFVFDWWNSGWHRSMVLTPEIARKREQAGRPLLLLKYALLLLVMRGLAGDRFWYVIPVIARTRSESVLVALGIATGLLLFGLRHLLSSVSPASAASEKNEYFGRGSVLTWLAIFLMGGLVEELWRALCIVALGQNSHDFFLANLLTAVAFSVAHQSGHPSRIPPGLENAGTEVVVGLMLGALFIWSGNLVAPCIANVTYYTASFSLVRWDFGGPDEGQ